ncbi:MAG TPA: glycosyltransferase family 87 protein [Dehalococcoidia bacterium]|nr:glycosyltransferase family 87 protein [Dehalococcoidia bacterium]
MEPSAVEPAGTRASWPLPRPVSLVVAIALIGVFVWIGSSLWSQLNPAQKPNLPTITIYHPILDDYVVYWSAGRMVVNGQAAHLYDQLEVKDVQAKATGQRRWEVVDLPFFNPPFIAAFMAPFALLPVKASALLFMALSLGGLALAMRQLLGGLSRLEVALWSVGIVSSMPFYYTLQHGQFSFLLLLLFTSVYFMLKRRNDAPAGAVLALLLMKPQLLLLPLIFLVADRRYAALRAFAITAGVLALSSLLVAGPGGSLDYVKLMVQATGWHNENGITIFAMFGWNAFFTDVLGNTDFSLVTLLALVAAIGTIGVCVASWRSASNRDDTNFDLRYTVLMLGTLLVSPHLYGQDLIIGVLPLVLLYRSAYDSRMKLTLAATFVIAWGVMYQHFNLLNATGVNFVTLMMFGLLLLGAWQLQAFERLRLLAATFRASRVETASLYVNDEAS